MRIDDDLAVLEDRATAAWNDLADPNNELPAERYRTDLYRLALRNLLDTIENHREYDGPPEGAKAFRTSVVRPHYRTHVEVVR